MGMQQLIVRMDPILVARIEYYAHKASGLIPGVRLTRSDAVRALVLLGLEKAGIGNPPDMPQESGTGGGSRKRRKGENAKGRSSAEGQSVGADLRSWREQEGLTQRQASKRLGVSRTTVSKYERQPETVLPEFLTSALRRFS